MMEIRFKEYYEKLLEQLSIDYNCTPADLQANENIITISALNERRRSYSPGKPFLQMVTLGMNTVIMADECLHVFCKTLPKRWMDTTYLNLIISRN